MTGKTEGRGICRASEVGRRNDFKKFAPQSHVGVANPAGCFMSGTLVPLCPDRSDFGYTGCADNSRDIAISSFVSPSYSRIRRFSLYPRTLAESSKTPNTFIMDPKPSNLDLTYIVYSLKAPLGRCVVGGNNPLSVEAQHNTTSTLRTHLRATLSARPTTKSILNRGTFDRAPGEAETNFNHSTVHCRDFLIVPSLSVYLQPEITKDFPHQEHSTGAHVHHFAYGRSGGRNLM